MFYNGLTNVYLWEIIVESYFFFSKGSLSIRSPILHLFDIIFTWLTKKQANTPI